MNSILWNIMLALIWAFATGAFTFSNLMLGFAVGFLILGIIQRTGGSRRYLHKWQSLFRLFILFIWELFLSNLRVAHDVLTREHHMRAGIIAIPLEAKTDAEITVLASLLSLTPGTLSLDISTDRRVLYVHGMYIHDVEAFRKKIKSGLEKRVLAAMR